MKRTLAFSLAATAIALLWACLATAADGLIDPLLQPPSAGQIEVATFLEADAEYETAVRAVVESPSCCRRECRRCGTRCRRGAVANCRCYPLWTASVDALVLRRDRIDSVPLVVDGGSGADLYNARDIGFNFQSAPRVSVARRLFPCHEIEFEFFGVNHWTSNATVVETGAEVMMYGATFGAEPINVAFSSNLRGAEVNWRRSSCHDRVKVLAGFRWLDLNDNLTIRDAASPPALFVGRAANQLYGFQLGAEATVLKRRRLEVEAAFKGGVYGSTADVSAAFPQAGSGATFTADGSRTAFVGEVMVGLNYQLTERLDLRVGYQMLWIEGVALLAEQLDDLAVPLSGEAQMGGRPIYYGYHVGLQYSF